MWFRVFQSSIFVAVSILLLISIVQTKKAPFVARLAEALLGIAGLYLGIQGLIRALAR